MVCVECYPGVFTQQLNVLVETLRPAIVIHTEMLFKSVASINQMVEQFLGDDPVFGRMNGIQLDDYFDPAKLAAARARLDRQTRGWLS